jgi:hypothetical protein
MLEVFYRALPPDVDNENSRHGEWTFEAPYRLTREALDSVLSVSILGGATGQVIVYWASNLEGLCVRL